MSNWPADCHDPGSCSRHRRCMYERCKHEREHIEDIIRYREHAQSVNRMNDKGEIPRKNTWENQP